MGIGSWWNWLVGKTKKDTEELFVHVEPAWETGVKSVETTVESAVRTVADDFESVTAPVVEEKPVVAKKQRATRTTKGGAVKPAVKKPSTSKKKK